MIEYVVETNPDDRVLNRASQIIRDGGLICFPTETNWAVVASPYSQVGVDKLYKLRHVENTKHFTILCDTFQKAQEVAYINDGAFRVLKKLIPGPYTFIFEPQKKITKNLKASKIDKEVGLRFCPKPLCQKLLAALEDIVISTHITSEMMGLEENMDIYGALIEDYYGQRIDLILDPGEYEFNGPTTIIDYTSGEPVLVRQGLGDWKY